MLWLLGGCLLLAERPDGTNSLFGDGDDDDEDLFVGEGDVVDVGVGFDDACAVYENGGLRCSDEPRAPAGEFVAIDGGLWGYCGIEADDTLVCTTDEEGPAQAIDVDVGSMTACAVTPGGELRCWGSNSQGVADPVSGAAWAKVSISTWSGCALSTQGRIECWGDEDVVQQVPDGRFLDVAASDDWNACAVTTGGDIECWGSDYTEGSPPRTGTFTNIVAGDYHYCVLADDGTVACWGDDAHQQASPPSGTFVSLDAEQNGVCGVTTEATVECWGDVETEGL